MLAIHCVRHNWGAWPTAFASKPAPTGFACGAGLQSCGYSFGRTGIRCRSALAREGIVSATAGVSGPARSPASRLLQVLRLARVFSRADIPSVVQISPRSCGYSFGRTGIRCRSALAREGIVSATAGGLAHRVRQQAGSGFASGAGVRSCATAAALPAKNPNYCFHRLPTYVRTPFSLPSQIRMMASSISQTRICPQCPST